MVGPHSLEGPHFAGCYSHQVQGAAHLAESGGASRWSSTYIRLQDGHGTLLLAALVCLNDVPVVGHQKLQIVTHASSYRRREALFFGVCIAHICCDVAGSPIVST